MTEAAGESRESARANDGVELAVTRFAPKGEAWATLLVLGHSLGGQCLALTPRSREVAALLTVTAGSGWYRHNHRIPAQVRLFWFVMIPMLTPLFGYFPGKALRMVGDLPRGVAWQWRRWCMHPEYLMREGDAARAALASLAIPIRGYIWREALDWLRAKAAP